MPWLVLIFIVATLSGLAALSPIRDALPFGARLAASVCVGIAMLGLVGYLWACLFGLGAISLALSMITIAAPLILYLDPARRAALAADSRAALRSATARPWRTLYLLCAAVALVLVVSRAVYMRGDGLYTGDAHNLGDLPFHIAIVQSFAYGENLPPEHPELAGARLTYPFLLDFVAALLVWSGASITQAFLAQNGLLIVALFVLFVHFAQRITDNEEAALIAPWLVLLNGGFGFWHVFADAGRTGQGVLRQLLLLPRDYTIEPDGPLRFGNSLTTLFVPQRAFLFGVPLVLLALALLFDACREPDGRRRRRLMIGAGLTTGLAPLAHMHSFAVLIASAACLMLLFRFWRDWRAYYVSVLALSLPQLVHLFVGTAMRAQSFLAWHVGWDRGARHPVVFWLLNGGLFIPLLLVVLCWRGRRPLVSRTALKFLAPFAFFFIAPNLLRLSPWIWDNIKFLFFFWLAAAPLVAALLVRMWRPGWRMLACVVAGALIAAGALDVARMATGKSEQRVFDAPSLAFARMLRDVTPPRALILHFPTYNHPVLLSGRRSLLGYPGHIPSQGLDAGDREQEIRRIYDGAADASALIARHGVQFIVLGPLERSHLRANESFLGRYSIVGEMGGHRLYRIADETKL